MIGGVRKTVARTCAFQFSHPFFSTEKRKFIGGDVFLNVDTSGELDTK
jgi:hypothetical protein